MSRRIIPLVSLALLGGVLPLGAQSNAELCETIRRSEVGQWAEYRTTDRSSAVQSVRIAVVGSEKRADRNLQWIEMNMGSGAERMVAQVLVPGIGFGPNDIEGMVVKVGDQPAMKMPDSMIGTMRGMAASEGVLDFAAECAAAEVLDEGSVTVPAGTFQTTHIKSTRGEAWISDDATFGLVKGRSDDGSEMVLAGQGTGAASSIQETPVVMPVPGAGGN